MLLRTTGKTSNKKPRPLQGQSVDSGVASQHLYAQINSDSSRLDSYKNTIRQRNWYNSKTGTKSFLLIMRLQHFMSSALKHKTKFQSNANDILMLMKFKKSSYDSHVPCWYSLHDRLWTSSLQIRYLLCMQTSGLKLLLSILDLFPPPPPQLSRNIYFMTPRRTCIIFT